MTPNTERLSADNEALVLAITTHIDGWRSATFGWQDDPDPAQAERNKRAAIQGHAAECLRRIRMTLATLPSGIEADGDGGKGLRLLTNREWLWLTDEHILSQRACEAVQRKFCEVNGLALSPTSPPNGKTEGDADGVTPSYEGRAHRDGEWLPWHPIAPEVYENRQKWPRDGYEVRVSPGVGGTDAA